MSYPFLGQIMPWAGNYAPEGWALCHGQLLAINQNQALFSLLGTNYGGDGITSFGLPDLRGRVPIHFGQSPTGTQYPLGMKGGAEQVMLTQEEMPAHSHAFACNSGDGDQVSPENNVVSQGGAQGKQSSQFTTSQNSTMAQNMLSTVGNNSAHNNMPPFLVINYCIALTGLYPSRN